MRSLIKYLLPIAATMFIGYLAIAAFVEPASAPPEGNVPAPINTGPQAQNKAGDLELENLIVREGITLGGERRTTWPEGAAACNWEGTKCFCADDGASVGSIRLTIGATCASGQLTDVKIMNLDISSRSKRCWSNPPPGCSPGLYSK